MDYGRFLMIKTKECKALRILLTIIFSMIIFSVAPSAFAQGGPPMITDDPGTPGNGMWEINIVSTFTQSGDGKTFEAPNIDLNYGLGNNIQLKFEAPWILMKKNGETLKSGIGNSLIGVKWRFIDEE